MSLGDALLTPTRIYVKALKAVQDAGVTIKGCSHITGGGFYENIPRMFRDDFLSEEDISRGNEAKEKLLNKSRKS
jgi:phosphoribosylformylglycinamidine cyclo-ligase